MRVVIKLREIEEGVSINSVEAVDPIGLPGFLTIIVHHEQDSDKHTSYVWPAMSIEHLVIETIEGEKFEHTNAPHWFKPVQ